MRTFAHLFLVLVFFLAVFSAYSQFTDADLSDQQLVGTHSLTATTLDFSSSDSATETNKSMLFSIVGMTKHGFQIGSVRIKKVGELPTPFTISVQQTGGDTVLCQALTLVVAKDWNKLAEGSLLAVETSDSVSSEYPYTDYIFAVSLPQSSPEFMNKTCAFTITFQTKKSETVAFSDTEVVSNTVSTGTWTEE